mmetsp:Transcript_41957/g.75319  ORF Transcript_41957/g.75319 Transcript_41957/m.75319 type:complete len:212 (-) Transcript_41957:128-763(-)
MAMSATLKLSASFNTPGIFSISLACAIAASSSSSASVCTCHTESVDPAPGRSRMSSTAPSATYPLRRAPCTSDQLCPSAPNRITRRCEPVRSPVSSVRLPHTIVVAVTPRSTSPTCANEPLDGPAPNLTTADCCAALLFRTSSTTRVRPASSISKVMPRGRSILTLTRVLGGARTRWKAKGNGLRFPTAPTSGVNLNHFSGSLALVPLISS